MDLLFDIINKMSLEGMHVQDVQNFLFQILDNYKFIMEKLIRNVLIEISTNVSQEIVDRFLFLSWLGIAPRLFLKECCLLGQVFERK